MATRQDVRRYGDATTDTFPAVGGYDTVEDVSGEPWPGAEMQARPRTAVPLPPARSVSRRTPVEINAETGQALGEMTERAAARAARRLALREMVEREHPSIRPMLEHLFGLNLPGI